MLRRGRADRVTMNAEHEGRQTDDAGEAVFVLDAVRGSNDRVVDFTFRSVNLAARRLLGRREEDVLGYTLSQLVPVARSGGFIALFAAALASGETLVEEFPIAGRDGVERWRRHEVEPTADGIVLISRDTTTLRAPALTPQPAWVAEAAPVALWHEDDEGRVVWANARFRALTGAGADREAASWTAAIHPDERDAAAASLQQSRLSGARHVAPLCLARPGRDTVLVTCSTEPLEGPDGQPAGRAGALFEIGEAVSRAA